MNNLSSHLSLVSLVLAALAAPATSFAQTPTTVPAAASAASTPAAAQSKDMAEAEVRKIDKDAKKVTLKHGPIKNLDMPSMTMVFQVRDAALFDKLVVGEKIMFTAEQLQGAFVMTGAEKVAPK